MMDSYKHIPIVEQREQGLSAGSLNLSELIDWAIGIARRRYAIIAAAFVATVAFGFVILFTSPAYYTSHARLLIDTGFARAVQSQGQQILGDYQIDTAQVDTQIELLKSDKIALSVVKDMKLTEKPEFTGTQKGFVRTLLGMIAEPIFSGGAGTKDAASEQQLTDMALGRVLSQRAVSRVGRTYVLDIAYTSLDPAQAGAVANGIADAYILDMLDSKFQATRRASKWLQDRIAELRQQALTADQKVLAFKEEKKIVEMGGANSRLLGDQQVADISTQLGQARAAMAEASARLDRIEQVMKQDIPDAAVADSLHSSIISQLRTQYLDYDRKYQLWSSRYGPDHLAAINIKTQMNYLRDSMRNELGRIGESYKSDLAIAGARVEALQASLATLISSAQSTNRERLGLQELETSAKVYHSIYDNFLQRFMEMSQQLSFPVTEARVISPAGDGGKTSPKSGRIMTYAGLLGLMLGLGLAMFKEAMDRVFRTADQVESILGTNCLAVVPMIKSTGAAKIRSESFNKPGKLGAGTQKMLVSNMDPTLRHVVDEPLLPFAEAFRSVKVAVDISRAIKENKVIGMTSSVPNEGKSTASANLAQLIANSGNRVLLIDGDLRNPTLSRQMLKSAEVGILEVLSRKVDLRQAIHTDEQTGLDFLPVVIQSHLAHSSDILASEAFRSFIEGLRTMYDYIIIDLSPMMPVVDVRATTKFVDTYVYVVEWGRTKINIVQRQFNSAPEVVERLLGVLLNKANFKVMDRYTGDYGGDYYKSYYSRYGARPN